MRLKSVELLFGTLKSYGSQLSKELWELILKGVVLPVFDDLFSHEEEDDNRGESINIWIQSTALPALNSLIDVFSWQYEGYFILSFICYKIFIFKKKKFFIALSFALSDILNLLLRCINPKYVDLSRLGVACFYRLIIQGKNLPVKYFNSAIYINMTNIRTPLSKHYINVAVMLV